MEARGQRRMNKGSRRRERRLLRAVLASSSSSSSSSSSPTDGCDDDDDGGGGYDRVLVDADCTHDGSTRHMGKVAGLGEDMCVRAVCWLAALLLAVHAPNSPTHRAPTNTCKTRSQTREGGFLSREKLEGLEALQRGLIW